MNNIICSVINVDCYDKDKDDIKYGEQKYRAFQFLVKINDKEIMTNYIRCMLYEYGIPFVNINNRHYKIVNEKDIHTPDMIRSIIENNKDNEEFKSNNNYRKLVK